MRYEPDKPRAFPADSPGFLPDRGMTLRDYFAAKALAALISHPNKDGINRGKSAVPTMAKFAYEYADAMLTERAK